MHYINHVTLFELGAKIQVFVVIVRFIFKVVLSELHLYGRHWSVNAIYHWCIQSKRRHRSYFSNFVLNNSLHFHDWKSHFGPYISYSVVRTIEVFSISCEKKLHQEIDFIESNWNILFGIVTELENKFEIINLNHNFWVEFEEVDRCIVLVNVVKLFFIWIRHKSILPHLFRSIWCELQFFSFKSSEVHRSLKWFCVDVFVQIRKT